MRSLLTLGPFLLALLVSCEPQPTVLYTQTAEFAPAGWSYSDSVVYNYIIQDTTTRYDLVLEVVHTDEFPYENFYVHLTTHLPDGQQLTQPLSLELADNYGRWYGKCDADGSCRNRIALQTDTRYTEPGEYRLVATQFSRQDTLAEIRGLTFSVLLPKDP